jgi:hypothetical protein
MSGKEREALEHIEWLTRDPMGPRSDLVRRIHRQAAAAIAECAAREEPHSELAKWVDAYNALRSILVRNHPELDLPDEPIAAREEPPCVVCGTTEELPSGDCAECAAREDTERPAQSDVCGVRGCMRVPGHESSHSIEDGW